MASNQDISNNTSINDGQGDGTQHPTAENPEGVTNLEASEEELRKQLKETESEILVLRQVLESKVKRIQELKKQLSITPWKEFREDLEHGIQSIQKNTVYQRTSQALGNFGASVSKTFENVKNNPRVKNLEEKVGSTISSVKSKVVGGSSFVDSNSSPLLTSGSTMAEDEPQPVDKTLAAPKQ